VQRLAGVGAGAAVVAGAAVGAGAGAGDAASVEQHWTPTHTTHVRDEMETELAVPTQQTLFWEDWGGGKNWPAHSL
jgi:hypothetical protein